MKRFSYILAIFAVVGLASCMREEAVSGYKGVSASLVKELGLDEPDMPVRLGFDLPGEKISFSTKASVVGGTEDPSDYIKTLYLVCFTREGIYLGWRKAVLIGTERVFTHDGLSCQGRDLFEGTVPSRTARIHFVGNVGIGLAEGYAPTNIPGNDQIGGNENTLIKSAKMTVSAAEDRTICYWGFHGENSSEDMKTWLSLATTDPVTGTVTYSKLPGHNIHMVRDRARVDFGYMLDFKRSAQDVENGKQVTVNGTSYTVTDGYITIDGRQYSMEKNVTDYEILSIHWILSNGLDKGYLAPYHDENQDDHFDGYFDASSSPALKEDRLTQYDKADASRYTATEEDMIQIYDGTNSIDSPLFLFEDENLESNPPKIILKVVYQIDDQALPKTKYHTLMMLNESQEPCKIYRNHNYILDIFGIPWEGLGYATFEDAVNSVTYANNQTITISEEVPAVNDGRYQLSVLGETSIIFQDPALECSTQTVYFTYQSMVADENTSSVHASDFKASWTEDVRSSFADQDITVSEVSNTGKVFKGAITFTLGTSINSALQGGQIELKDKLTGMTRFINVYTIDQFNYLPEGASELDLVATGESRNVNGVSCPTYKMDVRIPGDYPLGLYPIKMRMASITLNPFKVERRSSGNNTVEETVDDVAVAMGGTENGSVLDGETLAGMSFTTDAADRLQWNYHVSGDPWNFWFVDTIISKPTMMDGGESVEDTRDKVYTFYFDDIRGLRAAANRPENVGLFFKIKYFGDAVAVTP
ncbi:MAG: hypothetical protein IJ813_03435 [Bacteroidales bacterium]|nr:hypothetical protein [Bacteroidales bacterium]